MSGGSPILPNVRARAVVGAQVDEFAVALHKAIYADANSGMGRGLIVRNLVVVTGQRSDEAKLVRGIDVEDQRAESAQPPHAIMQNLRAGRLQPIVGTVAVNAAKPCKPLGVISEVDLIVGLMERAVGQGQLRRAAALECSA